MAGGASAKPSKLSQLRWSTWRGVLLRSGKSFMDDNCTDWAAALTYYGVLALFPAAIVIVALTSLVASGKDATDAILGMMGDLLPPDVMEPIETPIRTVLEQRGSAKLLLSFGAIGAIWSASGFVGAFVRASNAIYGVQEGRKWYVLRPLQLGLTVVALVLLAVIALGLIVSGPVVEAVGDALRIGEATRTVWGIGKWPVLVVLAGLLMSLLFWIAPNVQQPRLRWITVGGAVALLSWLVMSFGFGLYVANFGSYDATYGSLGAVVIFLVWLYLSNCALMLGVEINSELVRGRAIQAGEPADDPVLAPRAEP